MHVEYRKPRQRRLERVRAVRVQPCVPREVVGRRGERAEDAVVDDALSNWGSPPRAFSSELRAAYVDALRDPTRVHAICEEYRAAATIDLEHDLADRDAGRRIVGPVLALWSGRGPLNSWYAEAGGPLRIWEAWADQVRGEAVDGGHFFPEEIPELTTQKLRAFFDR